MDMMNMESQVERCGRGQVWQPLVGVILHLLRLTKPTSASVSGIEKPMSLFSKSRPLKDSFLCPKFFFKNMQTFVARIFPANNFRRVCCSNTPISLPFSITTPHKISPRSFFSQIKMAAPSSSEIIDGSCSSPNAQEPLFKLQKLNNGSAIHQNPPPLLKIKKLTQNATLPSRASPISAGYDLSSAVKTKVPARGKALVPTDLSISIPDGTYARIAPRSGLAWKHSIDVGAGVIDADYRGPVGVILFNHSDVDFEVKVGDRIAQMIIEKIMVPDVVEVDDLDSTLRGDGGFGSSGV